jgi:hypothetical protein
VVSVVVNGLSREEAEARIASVRQAAKGLPVQPPPPPRAATPAAAAAAAKTHPHTRKHCRGAWCLC